MAYALIQEGAVAQYPYSRPQFRRDNPQTSFPRGAPLPLEGVTGALHEVVQAERPETTGTQIAVPDAAPTLVDGAWVLGWTVRDKTADEIAAERESMKTSRQRFAFNSARAGIVSPIEAEKWGGGVELPSNISGLIDAAYQDPLARLEARLHALTADEINRLHPIILMLQVELDLSDEVVDGLFE